MTICSSHLVHYQSSARTTWKPRTTPEMAENNSKRRESVPSQYPSLNLELRWESKLQKSSGRVKRWCEALVTGVDKHTHRVITIRLNYTCPKTKLQYITILNRWMPKWSSTNHHEVNSSFENVRPQEHSTFGNLLHFFVGYKKPCTNQYQGQQFLVYVIGVSPLPRT